MKKWVRFPRIAAGLLLCVLLAASPAAAGTLTGVVRNGTTGTVVPRQDVVLIQLQGGMQPVETVKTDAQGGYKFDRPEIGQAPMLVRAAYRGINYNQNVPPGTATADIEIFEPNAAAASLAVVNHAIILQPKDGNLVVGEEFTVHNLSKPPATYFSADGTFEFLLPDGAQIGQVSAAGPAGMPLPQSNMEKSRNRYAIAFAFKPGENTVRISYRLPYDGNRAALRVVSPLPAQRVVLAGPAGLQISSDGFAPAGNEQGFTFYSHDAVAANFPVAIAVSGSPPPPSATAGAGDARDAGDSAPSASAPETAPVAAFAPRLASVQWILIAGFLMLFALGVFYLWRQPRHAGSGGFQSAAFNASSAAPVTSSAPPAPPVSAADVTREVRLSLDEMKDTLFRLELRHQAGTISEDDYARERARLEAVLRSLVRG
jgi:hypothetical protein